ncbi:hypothetical protein PoB_005138300 [Plakobranchus ocellatus]|uniref:Uncharacterized protein n=1 Tax=Plakobranchus ocellatus TaxID=259542 RepID=A0AAV4BYZ7_9GAST|nr:hypothetical protein PoB_005138300 [Plakobranchus ocellatus]
MKVILRAAEGGASPADLGGSVPEGFYERNNDSMFQGKQEPQEASSVRCSNELEQTDFQAEEVSQPVHKKRKVR